MAIETDPQASPVDLEAQETIALRRPDVPVTLAELAARKGEAIEILEARIEILRMLHKAALRAIAPEDVLLFKSPDEQGGQITAYLQDCGAERVRDYYGIEIFDVNAPEKILTNDPAIFHYIIRGSGRCKLTRQTIEAVEGGRSSTDDFCKDKKGAELELAVRKAARANLDGRIVRELAGLSNIPADDLRQAWEGTSKKLEHCRRGRGFGTRSERLGATSEKAPDVDPPICAHCGTTGVYRPATDKRRAFYGCPKWESHKDKKFIVDAEQWVAKQKVDAARTPQNGAAGNEAAPASRAGTDDPRGVPLTADDVFKREPGEEG